MRVQRFEDLPFSRIARELVGEDHGTTVTLLLVDAGPGDGPGPHRHPYEEIFVVQEGEATFRVPGGERVVRAGEIVVVPAGEPHAFTNTGAGRLRQVDIHASPRFSTEWLEDDV